MSKDQKWERVSQHVDLFRVEVPGGWIYKTLADGGATFVPRPATDLAARYDVMFSALLDARALLAAFKHDIQAGKVDANSFEYGINVALDQIRKVIG